MALIGLPYYVCASQMFDLQVSLLNQTPTYINYYKYIPSLLMSKVRFCMQFISGKLQMPGKEKMIRSTEEEMQMRWDKGYKQRQAHMMGSDQDKYYDDLSRTAQIVNLKPVMTKLHNESSQRFLDDLVNFRKDNFRIIDDETFVKLKSALNDAVERTPYAYVGIHFVKSIISINRSVLRRDGYHLFVE